MQLNIILKNFLKKINIYFFITNYLSFGLQILIGFSIFILIYYNKGSDELGIFIQSYAIFVILGQISTAGINESILQKISSGSYINKNIFFNGFIATLIFISIFCLLLFFLLPIIVSFFNSNDLDKSIKYFYIAVFFFGLNKIAFSYFISNKKLNYFAFLNLLRPLVLFTILIYNIYINNVLNYGLVFIYTEILIFFFSYLNIINIKKVSSIDFNTRLFIDHYKFGLKVWFNSFLSESFIRIDILIVGLLLSDRDVGVYGIAALFLEGVYQLSIVIRNILNPELSVLYAKNKLREIVQIVRGYSVISFIIITLVSILLLLIYDYILIFIYNPELMEAKNILIILLIGLCFYSFTIPNENFLFQANKPIYQSIYMFIMTLLNISLNYILILSFGLIGAALATSITFVFSILIFNLIVSFSTKLKYGVYIYNIN